MKVIRTVQSEATIQAELYMALKMEGMTPLLEQDFLLPGRETRTGRPQKIRVDIVLVDADDNALCCFEVKNKTYRSCGRLHTTSRQHGKYLHLGLPFKYCLSMDEIPEIVEWAKEKFCNRPK